MRTYLKNNHAKFYPYPISKQTKALPHWRLSLAAIVAEFGDSQFGDCRRFR